MKPQHKRVQAFPIFNDGIQLADFLSRAAWHFAHSREIVLYIPLAKGMAAPIEVRVPDGFAPSIQDIVNKYLPRIRFQLNQTIDAPDALLRKADIILKYVEGDKQVDDAVVSAKKPTVRVDPIKVRQEGSFYIQCAFDVFEGKGRAIAESRRKFAELISRIGRRAVAWVMATGPSVESYAEHDFNDAAVIACNSVVLNDELMQRCKPCVLVFADPIFHFGVSEYAGQFRAAVEHRLATTDLSIIVPLKYYPLLISVLPGYTERIIGIPFEKIPRHNFDLRENFFVKTTANILTLLLLPLATTLARQVNLIGCDGRPLEQDDYFWGHGKSVQINDKMENIQRVHPGFFAIDYNEYYFEHCHTLSNLLDQAEDAGWRFAHQGPSHIPALRDRTAARMSLPLTDARADAAQVRKSGATSCIVLEPDGVGMGGHYVRWHRNLIAELGHRFERVEVLCNRKQDPALYPCPARPTFTAFSWSISRSEYCFKRDFTDNPSFTLFVDELLRGIRAQYEPLPPVLSLYIYYGSVQILKAVQIVRKELLRQGTDLKAFVCLFHESAILDPKCAEPRFPPNAAEILLEGAAQIDNYRVASVTERLAELVLTKFGAATPIYPNPTPDLSDVESLNTLKQNLADRIGRGRNSSLATVLFPTNPRDEKGAKIISDLIDHLRCKGVPDGQLYLLRGTAPAGIDEVPGLEYLGDDVSDQDYWKNLRRADVVVVPYLSPAFRYRTSGILVDALVSAVPLVVLADTWLADVVQRAGAGLVVNYLSPLTLTSAVKVLLANRDTVRRRLGSGAEDYLRGNSWASTADMAVS
jgi:glycosyltransferase involved in cell wall biosynthesis